ncbi:MAG: fumarate hydratase, partial [Thermocrispum sp.]
MTASPTTFCYADVLPLGTDTSTEYRLVSAEGVRTVEAAGRTFLEIAPEALTTLAKAAITDIQHLLRSSHLAQLRAIVDDPQASGNDRFVAMDLLRNAAISAGGVLPMCQDTGTAIVIGKRTESVLTGGDDERALARGIFEAYQELNLRYSQLAPVTFFDERNTGTNLPAQIELYH